MVVAPLRIKHEYELFQPCFWTRWQKPPIDPDSSFSVTQVLLPQLRQQVELQEDGQLQGDAGHTSSAVARDGEAARGGIQHCQGGWHCRRMTCHFDTVILWGQHSCLSPWVWSHESTTLLRVLALGMQPLSFSLLASCSP